MGVNLWLNQLVLDTCETAISTSHHKRLGIWRTKIDRCWSITRKIQKLQLVGPQLQRLDRWPAKASKICLHWKCSGELQHRSHCRTKAHNAAFWLLQHHRQTCDTCQQKDQSRHRHMCIAHLHKLTGLISHVVIWCFTLRLTSAQNNKWRTWRPQPNETMLTDACQHVEP